MFKKLTLLISLGVPAALIATPVWSALDPETEYALPLLKSQQISPQKSYYQLLLTFNARQPTTGKSLEYEFPYATTIAINWQESQKVFNDGFSYLLKVSGFDKNHKYAVKALAHSKYFINELKKLNNPKWQFVAVKVWSLLNSQLHAQYTKAYYDNPKLTVTKYFDRSNWPKLINQVYNNLAKSLEKTSIRIETYEKDIRQMAEALLSYYSYINNIALNTYKAHILQKSKASHDQGPLELAPQPQVLESVTNYLTLASQPDANSNQELTSEIPEYGKYSIIYVDPAQIDEDWDAWYHWNIGNIEVPDVSTYGRLNRDSGDQDPTSRKDLVIAVDKDKQIVEPRLDWDPTTLGFPASLSVLQPVVNHAAVSVPDNKLQEFINQQLNPLEVNSNSLPLHGQHVNSQAVKDQQANVQPGTEQQKSVASNSGDNNNMGNKANKDKTNVTNVNNRNSAVSLASAHNKPVQDHKDFMVASMAHITYYMLTLQQDRSVRINKEVSEQCYRLMERILPRSYYDNSKTNKK